MPANHKRCTEVVDRLMDDAVIDRDRWIKIASNDALKALGDVDVMVGACSMIAACSRMLDVLSSPEAPKAPPQELEFDVRYAADYWIRQYGAHPPKSTGMLDAVLNQYMVAAMLRLVRTLSMEGAISAV